MEIRWLETFAAVSQEGNMGAAAQRLGYARSTVTGHIQSLEQSLGARLVDRRQAQALTPAGTALLGHVEEIIRRIDDARTAVQAAEKGMSIPLRLGATESLCAYRMPMFLRLLGQLAPALKVDIETAPAARLRRHLQSGRLNVVLLNEICYPGGSEIPDSETISCRSLWEDEPLMVGTPSAISSPKRVLVTEPGCVYREISESEFLPNLPGAEPMQAGSLEGVKSAVIAGLGIGLLPKVAVRPLLSKGQLAVLPLRTRRRVVTTLAWNRRTCPPGVAAHLAALGQPQPELTPV